MQGQKNQFWDDCGIWDSKQGKVDHRTYARSNNALSIVKLQNSMNCTQKMTDKWCQWIPMEIQPLASEVVTLSTYYATIKTDPSYKKHVSWLVGKPQVAKYEYQGVLPTVNAPHANTQHQPGEFVRTTPAVLANVKQGLQQKHVQPRDVFEELVLANDSGERPWDQKQVRNQMQAMSRPATLGKGSNVADELLLYLVRCTTIHLLKW